MVYVACCFSPAMLRVMAHVACSTCSTTAGVTMSLVGLARATLHPPRCNKKNWREASIRVGCGVRVDRSNRYACSHACVRACACVCVRAHACARLCVRACACVCVQCIPIEPSAARCTCGAPRCPTRCTRTTHPHATPSAAALCHHNVLAAQPSLEPLSAFHPRARAHTHARARAHARTRTERRLATTRMADQH